jgi:hypothetical protein
MYTGMSMYDDCNSWLHKVDRYQPATIGSDAEWQPIVKDEENPDSQYMSQSGSDQ